MIKWLYKHYKMVCMIFLGCLLVGWTAFTDSTDRKMRASVDIASGNEQDKEQQGPPTKAAEPTQIASADNGSDKSDENLISDTNEQISLAPTENPAGSEIISPDTETDPKSPSDIIENTENVDNPGDTDVTVSDVSDNTTSENTDLPDNSENSENGDNQEDIPVVTDTPDDQGQGQNTDDQSSPEFKLTFKYALANVESRLNIRSGAGTDNPTIAYLKPNGYCEVLEWGPEWTKIKSGTVTGYVYTVYLIFNDDVISKLKNSNKLFIRVTSGTVNIRSEATTESAVLGKGTRDAKYIYLPEKSVEGWYCIQFSETVTGFITEQYSEIYIDTTQAIPLS